MENMWLKMYMEDIIRKHFEGLVGYIEIQNYTFPKESIDLGLWQYDAKFTRIVLYNNAYTRRICIDMRIVSEKGKLVCEVDHLYKCDTSTLYGQQVTTKKLMNALIDMAREIGIKSVTLTDASYKFICGKDISLRIFYILKKGISWYNSLGFFSENFENEKIHNEHIRNKKLGEYKTKLLENSEEESKFWRSNMELYKDEFSEKNFLENNEFFKKIMSDKFWDKYSDMTLSEFVNEIWDEKTNTNNCDHIDVLYNLFNLLEGEIMYDNSLEYKVQTDKSKGGKRRSLKNKKKGKKRKIIKKTYKVKN